MSGDDDTGDRPLPGPSAEIAAAGSDGSDESRPHEEGQGRAGHWGAGKPKGSDGLLSHFVRRTDGAFLGVEDKSLIGEDVGWAEDELDEDGEPIVR